MKILAAGFSLLWLACATIGSPRCHANDLLRGVKNLNVAQSWQMLTPDMFSQRWPGRLTRRESGEIVTLQSEVADQCACCISAMFVRDARARVHLLQLRIEFTAPDSVGAREFALSAIRHFYPDDLPGADLSLGEPADSRIDRAFVIGSMPPQLTDRGVRTINLVVEKDSGSWHATIVANDAS
jgi:hypothetical protein